MFELSHYGCLLQELGSLLLTSPTLHGLDCHFYSIFDLVVRLSPSCFIPYATVDSSKLTTAQVVFYPIYVVVNKSSAKKSLIYYAR